MTSWWVLACAFLLGSSALVVGAELGNLQLRVGDVLAAYGESSVPVPLHLEHIPAGHYLDALGIRVEFDSREVQFNQVDSLLSGESSVYIVDQADDGPDAFVQLEVYCPRPVALSEGPLLNIYFEPTLSGLEDVQNGEPADSTVSVPLALVSGPDTWISIEGHPPLFPVPNLASGRIDLDLYDGVRLGSAEGVRAGVVEVPLLVTAVGPLHTLEVGIDYDEDMLEFLTALVTDEMSDAVETVQVTAAQDRLRILITFRRVGCPYPRAVLPTLILRFWIAESVPPGTTITLGEEVGWVMANGRADRVTAFYEAGEILVAENLSPRFKRGDVNFDGRVNTPDAVQILGHLFGMKATTVCPDAADFNDDGVLTIADAAGILAYVFQGAAPPAAPFAAPGLDPTYDQLAPCGE